MALKLNCCFIGGGQRVSNQPELSELLSLAYIKKKKEGEFHCGDEGCMNLSNINRERNDGSPQLCCSVAGTLCETSHSS